MPGLSGLCDVLEIEKVPLSARDLPTNTYEMIRRGTAIAPERPALSFFAEASGFDQPAIWNQRELLADVTRSANALRRLGIGRGDVVAFLLPNLPETHFVIWGGEAAGIAFALNPLAGAEQITELLNSAGAKWLVTLAPTPGADLWQKSIEAACQVPSLEGILTVSLAPYLRGIKRLAVKATGLQRHFQGLRGIDVLDFTRLIAAENADMLAFEQPGPDDISSYFCTGGTTGSPKIAKRTHFSEVFDAWAVTRSVFGDLAPGTTILCGLPLFHVNAQIVTGLIPWSSAGHVVLASPQGYRGAGIIDRFWAIAEHYAINAFSGVPTVYSALLRQPSEGFEISSIDWAFCGAAPMPVELFQRFVEQTGINILEGYGLTEGACVSSINPPRAKPRVGSIGVRLPYQEMLALILDADGNYLRDAETDEVGVIAINGPNVFAGYVDDAHTQSVWLQRGGERWLNTGDLGRQDADGYFWITGRRKELIIRGGHNIDPQTIEEPAHRHPAVALAAAVGRPDSHAGEVPVLYAELRAGAEVSEAELMAHCEATISERAARPRFVRIVDALPVTAIGKIHKPTLVCREIEDVIRCHARDVTADLIAIEARIDPNYGQVADVRMKGGEGPLREATSGYAFKVRFVNEFQGTQAS